MNSNLSLPTAASEYGSVKINSISGDLAKKSMTPEQMEHVAKDFESMFISQMAEQMFGDSIGDSAFGSEESSDIYKGLIVQEYGKIITQSGGIGIASYVKRSLLNMQEA